jgi:hypothetical protein
MLDNDNTAETLTVLSINLASTYGSQTRWESGIYKLYSYCK